MSFLRSRLDLKWIETEVLFYEFWASGNQWPLEVSAGSTGISLDNRKYIDTKNIYKNLLPTLTFQYKQHSNNKVSNIINLQNSSRTGIINYIKWRNYSSK